MNLQKTNILGVGVSAINMNIALTTISNWVDNKLANFVCVTPVHSVMMCLDNNELRHIYNEAGMVTPDGMPIVWLSRWFGAKHVSRVYGPDLLLNMCVDSLYNNFKQFFYGGADGVADLLVSKLIEKFPDLNVVGTYCPPFRELSDLEDQEIANYINGCEPDIIWIGLGAPKQEYWMHSQLKALAPSVLIGVGAAFDFHAGLVKQAPKWVQSSGFEWLFRLSIEPRRLWKRYIINNPRFIYNIVLQVFRVKVFSYD
jgi:N-acetylglucosaminyldiphosphoundecaprenol N-acetyl-beta-D-mannosaminyltransferase